MLIKQSESIAARRTVYITAVNTADDSAYTGSLSGADLMVGKAGGTEANSTGTATHVATGLFKYVFATAELDTLGEVSLRLAKTGVYNDVRVVNVVAFDPYTGSNLGLSSLDTTVSSRSSHSVADILDLADGVETGMTPRQALRLVAAILGGKTEGADTNSEKFLAAVAGHKIRATVTLVGSDRSNVAVDLD
ncbi:MAG: hypothetical protein LC130_23385 [Bryobacterales bacterium]|nr:hypothetical protein [Bryobacterales bacterium]